MNLVEIFLRVEPSKYSHTRQIEYIVFKTEIIKETDVYYRFGVQDFGHHMNKASVRKDKIGIIQDVEHFHISLHNIEKWIYVLEDENYNEEELKQRLIKNMLDELDNRRKLIDEMESLVKSVE